MNPPLAIKIIVSFGATGILVFFLSLICSIFLVFNIFAAIGLVMICLATYSFFLYMVWCDSQD
jgi:hypothetical protein